VHFEVFSYERVLLMQHTVLYPTESEEKFQKTEYHILLVADPRLTEKEVTEIRKLGKEGYSYPVCPQCTCTMDRAFQSYCDRCGQKLAWNLYGRTPRSNKKESSR
jgi:hypothetical protein